MSLMWLTINMYDTWNLQALELYLKLMCCYVTKAYICLFGTFFEVPTYTTYTLYSRYVCVILSYPIHVWYMFLDFFGRFIGKDTIFLGCAEVSLRQGPSCSVC